MLVVKPAVQVRRQTGNIIHTDLRAGGLHGRALDNVFVERLWRTVKYEYVYLNAPATGSELWQGLHNCFQFYNFQRPHQALGCKTPAMLYGAADQCQLIFPISDN